MISKIDSIKVSERVFDILIDEIENLNQDNSDEYKLNGYLSTFNNCREQGYYLALYNEKDFNKGDLYIWVCEERHSDDIMVVISANPDRPTIQGMFSEKAYNAKRLFNHDEEHKAVKYIIDKIIERL